MNKIASVSIMPDVLGERAIKNEEMRLLVHGEKLIRKKSPKVKRNLENCISASVVNTIGNTRGYCEKIIPNSTKEKSGHIGKQIKIASLMPIEPGERIIQRRREQSGEGMRR